MEAPPKSIPESGIQELTEKNTETGKKVFDFLERIKFLDIRKSDNEFDEWIQSLTHEDFSNYLTRLNGIVRDVPIHQRSIDGTGVEISSGYFDDDTSYLPPDEMKKKALMQETFSALQSISNNKDRALLLYYALQAIHPYADGNGRTGRLVHELLSDEGKELNEEKLSLLLEHNKIGNSGVGAGRGKFAEEVMDPNSAYYYANREVAKDIFGDGFIQEYGRIFVDSMNGVKPIPSSLKEKLSPEQALLTEKILGEGDVNHFPFRGIVIAKLISEKPELHKYIRASKNILHEGWKTVPEDMGKKMFSITSEELIKDLTKENALRLIEIHAEVKEKFIKCLIDIFAHPENHQLATKDGEQVPIKNVFSIK